jgi:acyl carrier protein phosphodiesterase
MKLAKQHPARFKQHFAVRKWVDIEPDMEFRGFVCNGNLNALSQYNHLAFFSRLPSLAEEIVKDIRNFWEKEIKEKLAPK